MQPSDNTHPYRWVMLALLFWLYVAFGLVARSISALVTPIIADLKLSYSEMGFILGSWQLTYIFAALAAGTILDKWGVRRSIIVGAFIIGLSASLRYFCDSFVSMLLAVALFGLGGPMISIGGPKSIAAWFQGHDRGTAMGIYTTGNWVGSFLALSLTNSVVMPLVGDSWRSAFVVYGMVVFGIGVMWLLFARRRQSPDMVKSITIIQVFSDLVRLPNVRLVMIMGLLSFTIGHGFSSWLPNILETGGMTPQQAGFASAISVAAGIPSILMIPSLVRARRRGPVLALLTVLTAVNLILVLKLSGLAIYLGLVSLGFLSAPFMSLLLLILMDSPGVEPNQMGAAGGMFFCVAEIGGLAGPLAMGALKDLTGTFMVGTLFLAGLCLAMAALTRLIER